MSTSASSQKMCKDSKECIISTVSEPLYDIDKANAYT